MKNTQLSNCCNAPITEDSDFCSKCGEHCLPVLPEKLEEVEIKLAEFIDREVYLPVKNELAGCGRTYSLGIRKERLKAEIHKLLMEVSYSLE